MLRLLFRKNPIHDLSIKLGSNPITHLRFITKSSISKIPKQPINDQNHSSSFTALYLINSCGLSPQSALSASRKITIKTTENPDSVLNLLKSYGFADTQIAKLVEKFPYILPSDPEKTVRPKLDFLLGVGCSNTQLAALISSCPKFLKSSLENRIIPNFDSLRPIFGTDQRLLIAVRRSLWLLSANLETSFLPNVRLLQGYRVPGPNITKLATINPRCVLQTTEQFKKRIDSTMKMGFDPSSNMFVYGMKAMLEMRASTWDRKVALFKSLGWSEEEVFSAFVKQPPFMTASDDKIRKHMDFFVKKMHWGPSLVAADPMILKMSFEKRVIPRCSVLNVLVSKRLVKDTPSISFLKLNEDSFLKSYVKKYQDQVPEVLKAYNGNLEVFRA